MREAWWRSKCLTFKLQFAVYHSRSAVKHYRAEELLFCWPFFSNFCLAISSCEQYRSVFIASSIQWSCIILLEARLQTRATNPLCQPSIYFQQRPAGSVLS